MKYVGLLSGGKDSCFNLLHCQRNGHELIAAASLGPPNGKEEIDSYLYQTVGQDAIEFIARALDVPLYRKTIDGTAVEQGSEYGGRTANTSGGVRGDETEDLFDLLSTVKVRHPDVQGVSVGAILSSYQRVRIEHVCRRLGLTVLAYLWQREQDELLQEMIDVGLVAVFIKVAGIGLTEKHLGKTLSEMQPTLLKLNSLYGSHICGEGGEYETLTLDCPLFKRRIQLTDVETVIHSDNGFAAVSYLRIKGATFEEKPKSGNDLTVPPLLEADFARVQTLLRSRPSAETSSHAIPESVNCQTAVQSYGPSSSRRGDWVAIGNVCRVAGQEITFEEEVTQCFDDLQAQLENYGLSLSQCIHINVYLFSMGLFPILNTIYATFFGTSPPTRACVAVCLPPPTRVKLDCFAYAEKDLAQRAALHVQGLSYWAPANIGPYSQAVLVNEHMFISGQIGLIPASLSLPSPQDPATETALVFQHTERVVNAVRKSSGQWKGHTQLAIYWIVDREQAAGVAAACELYAVERTTPTVLVGIPSLPKGATTEKQVVVHTGRYTVKDEEGIEEVVVGEPAFQTGESLIPNDGSC
ncbi:hypothetical protein BDM02DRAFT_3135608 [Thelephora ganbajun]|uniref:Uncharacterized protein n=1 Tax=Thelephora ganbajun TaxID=370292 RepID=A0ACB6ZWB0_THEGA|nr:hypothetical protein BDM02DRAFT_3135608 [Thelephora ganbajun]